MKRILIGLLIAGVVLVIALSTRNRLPRVQEAEDTVPAAVVAPGDSAAVRDSLRPPGDSAAADTGAPAPSDTASGFPPVRPPESDAPDDARGPAAPAQVDGRDAAGAVPAAAVQSAQNPAVNEILERAAAAYENVRSMQAEFTMTMTNPLLRRTTNSRGTLYQRRPDRIALRFSEPAGDVIIGDGRHFWIYYPSVDEQQVIRMPAGQGAAGGVDLHAQFVGDPTERFRATLHGTEQVAGRPAHVLTLEPRGPVAYTALRVWLDTDDYLARRFEIVEESGAVRRFEFTRLRTNLTLEDATFRFTPPAGARIVDRS